MRPNTAHCANATILSGREAFLCKLVGRDHVVAVAQLSRTKLNTMTSASRHHENFLLSECNIYLFRNRTTVVLQLTGTHSDHILIII
jgi:hypothetical protein